MSFGLSSCRTVLHSIKLRQGLNPSRLVGQNSTVTPTEHKVLLGGQTVYIGREIALALGWRPDQERSASISLTLNGWNPSYFTIAPTGSDSDLLSRRTVESSQNPHVKGILDYLKDR
ncbi:hypothetical protein Hypma_006648 [Hypsizygus marmoreus]|uniref:Uncharacterized protein n=1 Tax=Hypsizygus marmoreus TaxID=39966 RepID=A0A369JWW1_HYPMA|nr:hypothetical protein Hypma_006648 [Hypsizygus marmoreus]